MGYTGSLIVSQAVIELLSLEAENYRKREKAQENAEKKLEEYVTPECYECIKKFIVNEEKKPKRWTVLNCTSCLTILAQKGRTAAQRIIGTTSNASVDKNEGEDEDEGQEEEGVVESHRRLASVGQSMRQADKAFRQLLKKARRSSNSC